MKLDTKKCKNYLNKITPLFLSFLLWTLVIMLGLFVSSFILSRLNIQNKFLIVLITAFIISIFMEMIRSHNERYYFKKNWAFFYFLIYSVVLWSINEFLLIDFFSNRIFKSLLIAGVILSVIVTLIRNMRLKSSSLPWACTLLILILIVGNLGYLGSLIPSEFTPLLNRSALSEGSSLCPTTIYGPSSPLILEEKTFNSANLMNTWAKLLVNSSVWTIEHDFGSCYKGKYKGQFPERIYCDDLIVSRWERGISGAINYRWYTAVSAEWAPMNNNAGNSYIFNGFICENGQKVTVEKGVTNYYVYDSRSGGQIRIKY